MLHLSCGAIRLEESQAPALEKAQDDPSVRERPLPGCPKPQLGYDPRLVTRCPLSVLRVASRPWRLGISAEMTRSHMSPVWLQALKARGARRPE
jgi:hypothetical protein